MKWEVVKVASRGAFCTFPPLLRDEPTSSAGLPLRWTNPLRLTLVSVGERDDGLMSTLRDRYRPLSS